MNKDSQKKGVMVGTVVSDKNSQTRVIEVQTRKMHPKYKKTYNVRRRFVAHDKDNTYRAGDKVMFAPAKPYSKTKKFIIIGKI